MGEVRNRSVFVVTVWREGGRPEALRAAVLDVATGLKIAATQWRDIEDFMCLRSEDRPADEAPAGE